MALSVQDKQTEEARLRLEGLWDEFCRVKQQKWGDLAEDTAWGKALNLPKFCSTLPCDLPSRPINMTDAALWAAANLNPLYPPNWSTVPNLMAVSLFAWGKEDPQTFWRTYGGIIERVEAKQAAAAAKYTGGETRTLTMLSQIQAIADKVVDEERVA